MPGARLKERPILKAEFGRDRFPSAARKEELARETGNSFRQVDKWFNDARRLAKKVEAAAAAAAASAAAATTSSSPAAGINATDLPGVPSDGVIGVEGFPRPPARPPARASLLGVWCR